MVIHKRGDEVRSFARNGNENTDRYGTIIGELVRANIHAENCILDGEILAWNSGTKQFGKFSQVFEAAKNETKGEQHNYGLLCSTMHLLCTNYAHAQH